VAAHNHQQPGSGDCTARAGLLLTQQGFIWNLLMAGGTISILPEVILAVLLQRWLSEGISLSGLGADEQRKRFRTAETVVL